MGNKFSCCLKPNASPKVGQSLEWVNPHPESDACEVTQAAWAHEDLGLLFCKCHPVLRLSNRQTPKGEQHTPASRPAQTALGLWSVRKKSLWTGEGGQYSPHGGNGSCERAIRSLWVEVKCQEVAAQVPPPGPVSPGHLREKYSSCATVFVDSTISQSDLKITLQCLALAIYYHIKKRDANRSKDIFDERLHPVTEEKVPEEFFHHNPDPESIYRFIRPFFIAFKATGGYAITTLVYIERLLSYAEIDICPSNWKRIVLGAIILTYKYLHDEAMWNFHFFSLLRGITIKNLNELERQYICLLRFRLYVSTSVYAQYYFDLRSLASDHGLLRIALSPLRKERALNLEAISRYCENKNLCRVATKKSGSCANLTDVQRGHAILS
ncbi:cyclin-Y-like protein 1 [Myotis yumanensis]|uniref:cyclin-Y-like protein 1 n=1 Tax=Myotis yumanensis TaxID=159337 RepID=UPI0038D01F1C